MPVRQILALKRAAIQSRIDAVGARESLLTRRIDALRSQGDGLDITSQEGQFQIADMAGTSARAIRGHLERERDGLGEQRKLLARERLSLDIADQRLETAAKVDERLAANRVEDQT